MKEGLVPEIRNPHISPFLLLVACVARTWSRPSFLNYDDLSYGFTNSSSFSTDTSLGGMVLLPYHKHKAPPPRPANVLRNSSVSQRLLNYSDTRHQEYAWEEEAAALPCPGLYISIQALGCLGSLNILTISPRGTRQLLLLSCPAVIPPVSVGEPHEGAFLTCSWSFCTPQVIDLDVN